ncbi:MAG TPA: hypothetical protein ENI85_05055 [Deltaproteobacteria bacterium]|nr:hypothetical protein [Deltaproteobacteria bacterium]
MQPAGGDRERARHDRAGIQGERRLVDFELEGRLGRSTGNDMRAARDGRAGPLEPGPSRDSLTSRSPSAPFTQRSRPGRRRPTSPRRRSAAITCCVALPLLFVFAAVASAESFSGYVKPTALNVREAPGSKSPIVGILLKYDPVTVTGEENVGGTRWYSIEASGGYVKGWVAARFIARGEAPESATEGDIDYGAPETPTLIKGPFQYVGVRVCAECHAESTGDFDKGAYQVWQNHFHSQAFKSLQRDYTRQIASRVRGIDDPTTDWRCVKCHQTAFGADPEQIAPSYRPEDGVGCEVCHGPGSAYAEEDHGPDVPNREAMGFRVLRNLSDRREVCTSCHNRTSPTFIGFDLREFSRKIAHWVDKDDAAYYAEYDKEAKRRADRIQAAAKSTKRTQEKKAKAAAGGTAAKVVAGAQAAGAGAATTAEGARKAASGTGRAAQAEATRLKEEAAHKQAEARREAERRRAEAKAEADRKAEEARAKAEAARDAERARAEAAQAEAARKAEEARAEAEARAREEARKAEADRARAAEAAKAAKAAAKKPAAAAAAASNDPLLKYLDDVDDKIVMNTNGKKYKKFRFPHKKHATGVFLPEMTCQTCHHTLEGDDESPVACNECHDIGGDADEEKAKKRYVHTKGLSFPKEPDQEQISCVSCHKAMNARLAAGERTGNKAPVKCTQCHARKKKE